MLGNVYEWCHDGGRTYTADATVDPVGSTEAGADRVIRGGGWLVSARYVRSAYRKSLRLGFRSDDLGFRVMGTTRNL
jgi:formylglycine-generating enzyme required for sulfatase activity